MASNESLSQSLASAYDYDHLEWLYLRCQLNDLEEPTRVLQRALSIAAKAEYAMACQVAGEGK